MKPVVVFDVNETLLDLSPIRTWFTERFENTPDAKIWFTELLRLSFVSAATDRYLPFTTLATSALDTVASRSGTEATADDMARIAGLFTVLPPHSDVESGLDLLRGNGFVLAALTNSPQSTAESQLANAGISAKFDHIMSVEMVKRFKPHPSVYLSAANSLGVAIRDITMVAAHDWDVSGALAAGATGVFVERPGQSYSSAFEPPTMRSRDINDAAAQIIDRYEQAG
ncbi:MAG: haloacid dehalogenase type II [Acidimicrobiia bacterium]